MLKSLIKIRLLSLFSGGAGKDGKKKRLGTVGIVILMAFLLLTFAFFFLSIAASLSIVLVPAGLDSIYFAIFNILTFALVFVLSVFETKSELFECRDNELLLSLPVPPRAIVLSRSLTVIILNIGEALLVSVPALIMFVVMGGGAWYIPTVLISSVLLALLATALSSAVGYLVALISARMKNNTLITVVLTLGFLALYFVGYNAFLDTMTSIEENPDAAGDLISDAFGSIAFLGDISLLKPLPTTIFVVISVAIPLLAWFIISKHYTRIITIKVGESKKTYVRRELSSAPQLIALAKKELAAFFSSSAYILNGTMGAIFQIVIAVMLLVSRSEIAELSSLMGAAAGDGGAIPVLVTVLLVGCSSMVCISASALSIEGKRYWIIKSSPIPMETLMYAKLVPQLAISVPTALVSSILSAIAIGAEPLWWIFMILVPILACFVFAILGLILNIAMPKFDFVNDAQVVKQSMPVFILSFGTIFFTMALVFLAFVLIGAIGSLYTALIFAAFFILLFLAMYLILIGPSAKKLAKIG